MARRSDVENKRQKKKGSSRSLYRRWGKIIVEAVDGGFAGRLVNPPLSQRKTVPEELVRRSVLGAGRICCDDDVPGLGFPWKGFRMLIN